MAKVEIDGTSADQVEAEAAAAADAAEGSPAATAATDGAEEAAAVPGDPAEAAGQTQADGDAGDEGAEGAEAGDPEGSEADESECAESVSGSDAEPDTDALMQAAADALKKAQAEAADWQDKYLRLHAEWDTYRRRTNEQREAERARATEKLVTSLLPVIDDFERTIDYAENNGEQGLLSGVQAVHTKLLDVLVRDGVTVIDPAGEAFDALECQAVGTVEDASVPDETVGQVYQKGYKMGSKVLRPAAVAVTTGGPQRETPAADDAKAEGEE